MFIAEFFIWCAVAILGFFALSIFVFMMTGKSLLWRLSQLPNTNTAEAWLETENRYCSRFKNATIDLVVKGIKSGKYPPKSDHGEDMDWREYFINTPNPRIMMEAEETEGNKYGPSISTRFYGYDEDGVEYSLCNVVEYGSLLQYYHTRNKDWSKVREYLIKSQNEAEDIERRQRS